MGDLLLRGTPDVTGFPVDPDPPKIGAWVRERLATVDPALTQGLDGIHWGYQHGSGATYTASRESDGSIRRSISFGGELLQRASRYSPDRLEAQGRLAVAGAHEAGHAVQYAIGGERPLPKTPFSVLTSEFGSIGNHAGAVSEHTGDAVSMFATGSMVDRPAMVAARTGMPGPRHISELRWSFMPGATSHQNAGVLNEAFLAMRQTVSDADLATIYLDARSVEVAGTRSLRDFSTLLLSAADSHFGTFDMRTAAVRNALDGVGLGFVGLGPNAAMPSLPNRLAGTIGSFFRR